MKSLFITLLILATAFVAYDCFLAAPWERVLFQRGARPAPAPAEAAENQPREDAPTSTTPSPKAAAAADYTPSIPPIPSREFVPPELDSLESLTKNWTSIPPHAFPRRIRLLQPVEVKMSVGSSRLPQGATAYALRADGGNLTVAPTETSTARGAIPIASTDLPDQLRQSYDKWKLARIESARQAWIAKKTAKPVRNVTVSSPVDLTNALDAAGKPQQSTDGTYPLLLASMQSGQVTDITPSRINRWGQPEPASINGSPTWTVDVWYTTISFCGPLEVRAQAHVRLGRVVAWIFPAPVNPFPEPANLSSHLTAC